MSNAIATFEKISVAARLDRLRLALDEADDAEHVVEIEAQIVTIETYMRETGLWQTAEIRPVVDMRMRARWKLGALLSLIERGKPFPGSTALTDSTRFRDILKSLSLDPRTALEAQRLATLPEAELNKALAEVAEADGLASFAELIKRARPYWFKANRQQRHQSIAAKAIGPTTITNLGTFPLIYADPPWKFEVYSEQGLERTPDQHYPTLTDQEIIDFRVAGRSLDEIAHRDAALFMWCTSSNVERALAILNGWGFAFKTSAVWIKDLDGLGLVFRNRHELLLYGTRGNMPGPQYQPSSVFTYPRGEHSAKPAEIRSIIETMYPDFDARTRLELFARGEQIDGWTRYGNEAGAQPIAADAA